MSSKGTEMWNMFGRDSVLLEMFREEVYRDYTKFDFDERASQEAIRNQEDIFLDCLRFIEYLSYQEEDLISRIEADEKKERFKRMFEKSVAQQLLTGVENSMKYSGKDGFPDLAQKLEWLKNRV